MKLLLKMVTGALALLFVVSAVASSSKPNIIIYYADDISAREIPIYGSSVWIDPLRDETSDPQYRAKMPVLDRLATDGCFIKTAWAACVCNPSRAMMMSGRYAYQTKWWNNKDKGWGPDETGMVKGTWPVYQSSPVLIGHVAQKAGYGSYWSGKTQMTGSWELHGFDEGCFTPGNLEHKDNPYTDLKHEYRKVDGERVLVNVDNDQVCDTYMQHSWNFSPHVKLMNHPTDPGKIVWWPNTPESRKDYGLATFGPDVEVDFSIDFMERMHEQGKPFFVYHTTHLGHGAWDWYNPENGQCWPGTPKIRWDGKKYHRTEPVVTGDHGVYDEHGTITEQGMHRHLEYIDYQLWQYQQKLEEMGVADNTIIIFAADNGTAQYGKNSGELQKGCHIPFIIYAPGMKKHGEQDVLVSVVDVLPTVADLIGFEIPADYHIDGESMVPFLFTEKPDHRDWIYTQRGPEQLIRGKKVLKDGRDKWFDVSGDPTDLISFDEITNWGQVSEAHIQEHEDLQEILPMYDNYFVEFNAPGVEYKPAKRPRYYRKPPVEEKPAPLTTPSSSKKSGAGKTKAEFTAYKKVEMEKKGKAFDQAKIEKLFDKMDANGDGRVTREETQAYYKK